MRVWAAKMRPPNRKKMPVPSNNANLAMVKPLQQISLMDLSEKIRSARDAKGWTFEQLAYKLRDRGLSTGQNKLWRLENDPPKRLDTELLLYLEKLLEVELIEVGDNKQVFIEDVLELVDSFIAIEDGAVPEAPANSRLHGIHERLMKLSKQAE